VWKSQASEDPVIIEAIYASRLASSTDAGTEMKARCAVAESHAWQGGFPYTCSIKEESEQ
jgi:hypothetical protein